MIYATLRQNIRSSRKNTVYAYRKIYMSSRQYNECMSNTDEVKLTEEELESVNKIILGIQSDLEKALDYLKANEFDKAVSMIKIGLTRTNCPVCHKKLKLLAADVEHTKAVCHIDESTCSLKKEEVQQTTVVIKDEFVPISTEKRAIKEKRESLMKKTGIFPTPRAPPSPLELINKIRGNKNGRHVGRTDRN